jgi:ribosome-binding protein aMBF1 (putative translation factor)
MDSLEKFVKIRGCRVYPDRIKEGFDEVKIGKILRTAREEAGFTQEEVARRLRTKKSAISRIENHSVDIRLSTLKDYVEALGKKLYVEIS